MGEGPAHPFFKDACINPDIPRPTLTGARLLIPIPEPYSPGNVNIGANLIRNIKMEFTNLTLEEPLQF